RRARARPLGRATTAPPPRLRRRPGRWSPSERGHARLGSEQTGGLVIQTFSNVSADTIELCE
ncbi:MAG TPA: hypothetical protein RMH26_31650, partial [Polyangiaceae bacterium LLY-WYZ-15_(1-7)]|nr:hypothetical protein [Polyangiaceae bacterium LLY-WYZ-15_(1-7)]